jgi:hypothetical protein
MPTTSDPALLEVEADATAAAADVEDAAADEPHRAPFVRVVPAGEGGEQIARVERHDEPVVALDDLMSPAPGERVGEQRAVDVVAAVSRAGHVAEVRWLAAPVPDRRR